uniref:Phospholipid-transporting ATPase n=1 Tax=Takifugu rubripes TaxID=31033 RepID=A0A674P435_TAKRU
MASLCSSFSSLLHSSMSSPRSWTWISPLFCRMKKSTPRDCIRKKRTVVPSFTDNQELSELLKSYKINKIHTTKYSFLSFLPKNLFEQLHRIANIYFILIAALNFVPVVEAFQAEIALVPILFVLTATALKDIWEDYRRFKSDFSINRLPCHVFDCKEKAYVKQCWKDVRVGDFVQLSCNEIIPADMLLLHSSDPRGVCYIETANLDGETNLKQKQVGDSMNLDSFHSRIECEKPNHDLSSFRGYIEHPDGRRVGLHNGNLLLRSCTIRNTENVVGIVIYAGHETKAMMNNSGPRCKCSLLERRLNTDILWCVVLLIVMCLTSAIGHGLWVRNLNQPLFETSLDTSPALAGFHVFWTMIIVLQVLIPISLYVSIEIVKLGQIYFIHNDQDLYNEQLDASIQCRALNITEDLGQIQYLFSDKTGTLTENKMVFSRCSIYGVDYPHEDNARRLDVYEDQSELVGCSTTLRSRCSRKSLSCRSLSCNQSSLSLNTLGADPDGETLLPLLTLQAKEVLPDPELLRKLSWLQSTALTPKDGFGASLSNMELVYVTDFFLALSICNSVVVSSPYQSQHVVSLFGIGKMHIPIRRQSADGWAQKDLKCGGDRRDDGETEEGKGKKINPEGTRQEVVDDNELLYEAESPDEAALVHAAHVYGFTLRGRSADHVLVDLPGIGSVVVQLLHILPFDSNRRRMSVVVRHPLSGQVVVYTKGADSVIMDLNLSQDQEVHHHIREQTQKHLDSYARDGLRTLCIAKKVLEEREYEQWLKRHLLAESSIENQEELLQDSAKSLETNLTLLGTTGILDRLQEEVPETIEALQRAGIKLWVLTGDKMETAINIAYASKLLRPIDQLLTVNCDSKDACAALLEELKLKVQHGAVGYTEGSTAECHKDLSPAFVLVVDGSTLDWALQEELKDDLLELSCGCKAVICCRSTPLQKSQVVRFIRDKLGVMTLAVGDGANDVSMIQVANVGIGICGQEGMQAVMSSDFAISRFKHLRKLLLVHGHWCYSRLANMILYFIYKNVMFVNLLFWYQFFCGFSGSVMSNSWVLILFNLVFTSAPPLIYSILDQDIPAETLLKLPELYRLLQRSVSVPSMFWITVLDAFYQSIVCFFVPYFALAGSDVSVLSFGSPINSSALLIILLHQVLESHTLTWIHVLVLLLSFVSYFGFVLLFSLFCVTCSPPTNPLGVETLQMSQPMFYIICILTTFLIKTYSTLCSGLVHNISLVSVCFQVLNNLQIPVELSKRSSSSSSTSATVKPTRRVLLRVRPHEVPH